MERRRLPFSSALGTVLPLCLLWGFIACVQLCLHHSEGTHDAVAAELIDDDCGDDGCPAMTDTEFVTPSRQLSIPPAGEVWRACRGAARAPEGVYASAPPDTFEPTPTPSVSPPHESLCVLRI